MVYKEISEVYWVVRKTDTTEQRNRWERGLVKIE